MLFKKKPVIVQATQWFKNGDHPLDHTPIEIAHPTSTDLERYAEYLKFEGKIVRYYRHPSIKGQTKCKHCDDIMHNHGWIETLEGGHITCPGDWVITGVAGEHYPCKPAIFVATYEKV